MTDAETLQHNIELKLKAIQLEWIEGSKVLYPSELSEIRRMIELNLADLKDLLSNLDTTRHR